MACHECIGEGIRSLAELSTDALGPRNTAGRRPIPDFGCKPTGVAVRTQEDRLLANSRARPQPVGGAFASKRASHNGSVSRAQSRHRRSLRYRMNSVG
jgi:hypothetical protein